MKRINSLDILKGLIIVLMSLDHFRDYFHYEAFFFNPTDPELTNNTTFFIRWITHYCAPVFAFLAGVSAYIVGNKYDKKYLSKFLLSRGIWLVFVEIAIMNFGWKFDIEFDFIVLGVIWMLGICMILLSGLIWLSLKQILIFSLFIIFGHNLLDVFDISENFIWAVIHKLEFFNYSETKTLAVVYPIVPWIGVMSLGYFFGQFFQKDFSQDLRIKILKRVGIISIIVFFIVRFLNSYGNSKTWINYDLFPQTIYSFMDPQKYPPSLSYLLIVFGRVPFFFYILHVYFIHFFAMITAEFTGFGWESMILKQPIMILPSTLEGFGFNTLIMLILWICFVAFMYPLCKKFGQYRINNKQKKWLSYL